MKTIIKYLLIGIITSVIVLFSVLYINHHVNNSTKTFLYNSTKSIPHNKVGLLLGTAKFNRNGKVNLYYRYRIIATVALYKAHKIDFVLVSGDNHTKSYDEPSTMRDDLIAEGIPASKIYLDYAGFRTFDSVVRCKEIFGQTSITVISQQFHNERAIYIANYKNIQAVGFNAKDVSAQYGLKTKIREVFARTKMVLDLIFGKEPKFLGEKIIINY